MSAREVLAAAYDASLFRPHHTNMQAVDGLIDALATAGYSIVEAAEIDRLRAENERLRAEVGKPLVDRLLAALNEYADSEYQHVPDGHARIDGKVVRLVEMGWQWDDRDRPTFSRRCVEEMPDDPSDMPLYVAVPLDSKEADDDA